MTINYINLFVGKSSTGNKVFEKLPVLKLENNIYQLLISPGLVLGLAKGDQFEYNSTTLEYELVKRSGNLSIQIYKSRDIENLEAYNNLIQDIGNHLNGTLDGDNDDMFVFTIPVSVGFHKIENLLNNFIEKYPDSEWYYGNVYDEDGETPLNWWNDM